MYVKIEIKNRNNPKKGLGLQESSAVVAHSADAVDGEDTAEELEMHRKINRQLSAGCLSWADHGDQS